MTNSHTQDTKGHRNSKAKGFKWLSNDCGQNNITEKVEGHLQRIDASVVIGMVTHNRNFERHSLVFRMWKYFHESDYTVTAYELAFGFFPRWAKVNIHLALSKVYATIAAVNAWKKNESLIVSNVDGTYRLMDKKQYTKVEYRKQQVKSGFDAITEKAYGIFATPIARRKKLAAQLEEDEELTISNKMARMK